MNMIDCAGLNIYLYFLRVYRQKNIKTDLVSMSFLFLKLRVPEITKKKNMSSTSKNVPLAEYQYCR